MEGVGEKRRVIPRFEFKGRPLDKTESNVVLKTLMYGADCFGVDGKEVPLEKDEEIAETFYAKVFLKRIECYKLPFKVSNIFFMLSCMTWVKSPAAVMMLLRLLWQDYAENKTTYYDMNTWAEKLVGSAEV